MLRVTATSVANRWMERCFAMAVTNLCARTARTLMGKIDLAETIERKTISEADMRG